MDPRYVSQAGLAPATLHPNRWSNEVGVFSITSGFTNNWEDVDKYGAPSDQYGTLPNDGKRLSSVTRSSAHCFNRPDDPTSVWRGRGKFQRYLSDSDKLGGGGGNTLRVFNEGLHAGDYNAVKNRNRLTVQIYQTECFGLGDETFDLTSRRGICEENCRPIPRYDQDSKLFPQSNKALELAPRVTSWSDSTRNDRHILIRSFSHPLVTTSSNVQLGIFSSQSNLCNNSYLPRNQTVGFRNKLSRSLSTLQTSSDSALNSDHIVVFNPLARNDRMETSSLDMSKHSFGQHNMEVGQTQKSELQRW